MKVAFYSNFLNHHQLPFCLEMNRITKNDFTFVATDPIPQDKLELGYRDMDSEYPFVLKAYDPANEEKAMQLTETCDVIIFGQAPEKYLLHRMETNELTFRYSERVYKKGMWRIASPRGLYAMLRHNTAYRRNELYLLCASAYTAYDYSLVGAYRDKAYKWGYFPDIKEMNINELILQKKNNSKIKIIWVARFIPWKHPETAIQLAERLKKEGFSFEVNMIGIGELEAKIKEMIDKKNLAEDVHMLGAMSPENVRKHMEQSDIFLFTSDFNEGWGAVLNEAMNSACAVVASHAIGSVPFVIKNGENGLIYRNGDSDDLYEKVCRIMNDKELRESLSRNAYSTLITQWNAKVAAERFVLLSESIINGKETIVFPDGPCSPAPIIHNGWYRDL